MARRPESLRPGLLYQALSVFTLGCSFPKTHSTIKDWIRQVSTKAKVKRDATASDKKMATRTDLQKMEMQKLR
jgi:hypothetical protein